MNYLNPTGTKKTALYCYGSIKPAPNGNGASRRFWVDIKAMESIGYNVVELQFVNDEELCNENIIILPKLEIPNSRYWFGDQFIKWIYPMFRPHTFFFPQYCENISNKLLHYINKYKPDLIFYEHSAPWVAGFQLDLTLPSILCVHDFDDILKGWKSVHNIQNTRQSSLRRSVAILRAKWIAYGLKRYSLRLFKRSNKILTCGKSDYDALIKRGINTKYVPIPVFQIPKKENLQLIEQKLEKRICYQNFVRIVHVGGLYCSHNSKGVRWFLNQCLPILKDIIEVHKYQIHFIGSTENASDEIMKYKNESNLYFRGFVNDIEKELTEADFAIVPPGFPTGFRTKIPEAFAYGLPVVTGTYDAYGVGLKADDPRVLIADSPQDYAEACVKLINDSELRCKMGKIAIKTWREDYDPEKVINDTAEWIKVNAN